MQRINLPFFYRLGSALNSLSRIEEGVLLDVTAEGVVTQLLAITRLLEDFLEDKVITFVISKPAGEALREAIRSPVREWFSAWETDSDTGEITEVPSRKFSATEAEIIASKAKEFETVFLAEFQTLDIYAVSQIGIYSTPTLIEHAEHAVPESLRSKLPKRAIEDVQEAGRCLAFQLPTACGFHIIRATEVVLHEYYLVIVEPESEDTLANWGAYIKELKDVNANNDTKKVTAILQQIKDLHRNPIMHPEVVLSPDDAGVLFSTAISVIVTMAQGLSGE